MHVAHKMAEFALNKSHRYSSEDLNKIYKEEHDYLLSRMHQKRNTNDSDLCLALIPSTWTWIDIDCHRKFINVSFICEYSTESKITCSDEYHRDIEESYCEDGWFWIDQVCASLSYIRKTHIEKSDLDSACKKTGGKSLLEKHSNAILDFARLRLPNNFSKFFSI